MIPLYKIISSEFLLLHSSQLVEEAVAAIQALQPNRVIVRLPHGPAANGYRAALYFLFSLEEILTQLTQVEKSKTLQEALVLDIDHATTTCDPYDNAEHALERCIVLDEDRVLGFKDITVDPRTVRRGRTGSKKPDALVSRSVKTDFPEEVIDGQTVSLFVSLVEKTRSKSAIPVAIPPGTKIEIVILPQTGFVIEGRSEGSLVVTDERETRPLKFKVRAIRTGRGKIRVLCFQNNQPLGTVTLTSRVVAQASNPEPTQAVTLQPLPASGSVAPDLSLVILEQGNQDQYTITFRLSASDPSLQLNLKAFGPIRLQNPLAYFQAFFDDIELLRIKTSKEIEIATRKLELKGAHLFKSLLPNDLQVLLWSLRNRVTSVHVQSDEPWIPWELLRLQGEDESGRTVEGQFFCEAFDMTRWFPGTPLRPKLTLNRMAVVVPSDSRLPLAADELQYLLSLESVRRTVTKIKPSFEQILEHLSFGVYDGWHFTGHGEFNSTEVDRSRILLEKRQTLCPENISGTIRNCGIPHPLVFLNACQTGREAMSLTGMGGWAKRFVDAGAACFIGPLWSVYDNAAHRFSLSFYEQLLAGATVGRAVREARQAARQLNNPSWLAYTVFADPFATAQQSSELFDLL